MVTQERKIPAEPVAVPSTLSDLVRDFAGFGDDSSPSLASGVAEVELLLSDLITDENGEVVLFNDSGLRTLAIATEAATVANGQATEHVTAGGEDVSGFKFVTFDNGLTIYFPDGLDLVVTAG